MENIKIVKITSKTTKNAKPYKMCEVEVNGEIRKVNIWSNAPDFANLTEGSILSGKMTMEGQYWNIDFGTNSAPRASQGFKTAQAKEVIDYKQTGITKSQENKENSIKIASTMRMAVDLAIAEYRDETVLDTLEQSIKKWRAWCWENWDAEDKDFQAFNS